MLIPVPATFFTPAGPSMASGGLFFAPPVSASTPLSLKGPLPHSPKRRAKGPKLDEPKRWLAVHHGEAIA
jgi:hypothetical protein